MTDNINEVDDGELDELDAEILRCAAETGDKKQKPSKSDLIKSLDYLSNDPVLANAMRHVNRKPNSIFVWLKASREGDPRFRVRWPDPNGGESMYHECVLTARSMQLAAFEGMLRRDVSLGRPRVLRQQNGEPVWEIDSLAIAQYKNAEDAEAFGGLTDFPFAHDQTGARIAVVVYDVAAAALVQHVSRATLAGYNPATVAQVDNRHSGGVMVVRATAQGDDGKKAIPAYAREKMAEAPIAKPMSELQRDLLTRLEDLRSRPDRATVRPSMPVDTGAGGSSAAGDPVERTGDGTGKAA